MGGRTVSELAEPRLDDLMVTFGTDKQNAMHGYADLYERHFGPLRRRQIRLLEIGVWTGASIRAWAEWFPHAEIVGLDVDLQVELDDRRVTLVEGDVKTWLVNSDFDIVIDDGSHVAEDMYVAFHRLWPKLRPGGWYVIEDLETQFHPEWGGSTGSSKARMLLYSLLDDTVRESQPQIVELHAYRQIVFMRKAGP